MSYPPPPGTNNSLPPRPPPTMNSFARFAPRQVASTPHLSAPPQHTYAAPAVPAADYSYQAPTAYPGYAAPAPAAYSAAPSASAAPHIVNPFPLPGQRKTGDSRYADLDPELQAQIAQQQSIYDPSNAENLKARNAPRPATVEAGPKNAAAAKVPTVVRQGGGQTWTDSTLLEWDPSHFRLFVGNLAGEVTDDSLLKAFSKYPSVKKARVVRDKRTTKSKGYGFVAFADGDEYFRAAREMQGKYIGSHPVLLKRSNTEIKPVVVGGNKTKGGRIDKNKNKKNKGKNAETRKVLG
ncbi:hypothetical protein FPQ18DRAFT_342406 [Pyronema domesticum]|uniref:Similar to Uncharacterized RNA-binding protein C22E12.02 acc. no. Q10355 n=1 Tax=Pyronema omphalodes (strain CBS 100304) TaxID=1076935 RepID=U4LMR1_PYROM|nr:hypothetical protein FPQ18DRAFT_342406 [Pyronema domesticum]CCX30630.1 Similar to Uncharacterized RNA-binding protein C22E12.02; acc. no. Q10355 [Pyronema omphalodes CBS 100304]